MQQNSRLPVVYWLLTGCFLIFIMVIVGGITRLTQSGLSIVEWDLLMGAIPPLNQGDWQLLFEKYQNSPQYKLINVGYTLDEFKSIFWWEYIHRLIGRFIGLVFFVPFLYFLIKKKFDGKLVNKLIVVGALGAFQGVLGWFMVKSGLSKDPFVSHYRLAAHLITAFASFGFTFWVALGLMFPEEKIPIKNNDLSSFRKLIYALFGVTILQIIYGAFVAGLHAGRIYNTFPLMGDTLMPESVYAMSPLWKNLIENLSGVQFIHRYIAYLVVILVGITFYKSRKLRIHPMLKRGINFLSIFVIIQFLLGVFTLIYAVPVSLGVIHQVGAFILFANLVYILFHLRRA